MFPSMISNSLTSVVSDETTTISSCSRVQDFGTLTSIVLQNSLPSSQQQPQKPKKKRNLPGNPDPDAEVIALSPTTLMATNRFVCEVCNKGFQRDQNLQLHRRGHNLPWKLKQRNGKEIKKRAYVCPEATCLHHHPSRALGDLTGIKKHYCRKHGEKKWKCEKCSKIYAVQSDWKAHSKTCGTREYRCDCGTLFSRKDSFITHRAFCDALAEESARISAATNSILVPNPNNNINNNNNITTTAAAQHYFNFEPQNLPSPLPPPLLPFSHHHRHFSNQWGPPEPQVNQVLHIKHEDDEEDLHYNIPFSSPLYQNRNPMVTASPFASYHHTTASLPPLSATALLQKAATMGGSTVGHMSSTMAHLDMHVPPETSPWRSDGFTRDFLGLTGDQCAAAAGDGSGGSIREVVSFTGGGIVNLPAYDRRNYNSVLKNHGFGYTTETCSGWGNC